MGPYRPNGQSRRSGARGGYVDHDVFEGLPVRHWRRTAVQVGVPPKNETKSHPHQPELPLPKEAHLLSPMSRALLQAARAGTINKPSPAEEEAVVKEGEDEDEDEECGFVASRWSVVPRHLEGPEPEYLAKKRKGLEAKLPMNGGGVMKKAKVRRTDTDGNAYVEEIVIAEGQKVEGEVIAEVTLTDAGAPGTLVDRVGVVNADGLVVAAEMVQPTPPRRRPPPPRRKPKGPGRGRKKKVQFHSGAEGTNGAIVGGVTSTVTDTTMTNGTVLPGEVVITRVDSEGTLGNDEVDTEMADDSNMRDGEDEEDDNEDGEEGDEGDGDEDDREEGELSPSPTPHGPMSLPLPDPPRSVPSFMAPVPLPSLGFSHPLPPRPGIPIPTAGPTQRSASSSPDLPLAAGQRSRSESMIKRDDPPPPQPPISHHPIADPEAAPTSNGTDATGDAEDEEILADDIPEVDGQQQQSEDEVKPQIDGITDHDSAVMNGSTEDEEVRFTDGEVDLFGSLERHLAQQSSAAPTVETIEAVKPVETVEAVKTVEAAEAVKAVEAVETVDVVKAIDAVEGVDAVEAVDAGEAVDAVEAVDAIETVDAVEAVDAVETEQAIRAVDVSEEPSSKLEIEGKGIKDECSEEGDSRRGDSKADIKE